MQFIHTTLIIFTIVGLSLAALWIGYLIRHSKKTCSHLFDPPDMQNRDENGKVKWKCCKCGKLFIESCGLDILKHGKCTGSWGVSK